MTTLDTDHPAADLLTAARVSQSELARRTGRLPHSVSRTLAREEQGTLPRLDWLREAAEACGFRLVLRLEKNRSKK